MKESSRQLVASEVARDQLNSELEYLRLQLQDGHQWQAEKQVLPPSTFLSASPFLLPFLIPTTWGDKIS